MHWFCLLLVVPPRQCHGRHLITIALGLMICFPFDEKVIMRQPNFPGFRASFLN